MDSYSLLPLTLLDYPGQVACTVFTAGCNFRCPFCQNPDLVLPGRYPVRQDRAAILSFLERRKNVLDGVCVTGGEPTCDPDLPGFLEAIKQIGYAVKLDTNGSHPELLNRLLKAGLVDYVAMDIKNSPERWAETAGLSHFDFTPIQESVSLLQRGNLPFEFRTTVVRPLHDAEAIREIGSWLRGKEHFYLQKFRDTGDLVQGKGLSAFREEEMKQFLAILRIFIPNAALRGM